MKKGVVCRRGQNERGGDGASSILKALELGLTPGQEEKIAGKRPHPYGSLMVNQDSCRETTGVPLFYSNRLTYRPSEVEEAIRPLDP